MKITNKQNAIMMSLCNDVEDRIDDAATLSSIERLPKGAVITTTHRKQFDAARATFNKRLKALKDAAEKCSKLMGTIEDAFCDLRSATFVLRPSFCDLEDEG